MTPIWRRTPRQPQSAKPQLESRIAVLTAKADLIVDELDTVVAQLNEMIKKKATHDQA